MRKARQILIHSSIIVFVLGITWSCSLERKLAMEFTKSKVRRSALLIAPSIIYKTSLKTEILDSLKVTDESLFDSVLFANSSFLQHINDELFIDNYRVGFSKELNRFGFDVYLEDKTAEFMNVDSNAYLISIAQLEMEEVFYPMRDETIYYEMYYYHDHTLNGLYINSWFEISELNDTTENNQVYFASDIITDDVDGDFALNIFAGNVTYSYNIDTLKYEELYDFAYLLGRTYAGYTYDLLLNRYVNARMPKDEKQEDEYLRYDPITQTFFLATEDRFIPLED